MLPFPYTAQEGRPTVNGPAATPSRSDAGQIRLTGRDIAGLVPAMEMQAVPYGLFAVALASSPGRERALAVRRRRAGLAAAAATPSPPAPTSAEHS
jgi:hypothetical protein